jgi:hypothetical protein
MHAKTRPEPRDEYTAYWQENYKSEPYFDPNLQWEDFNSAYQYAYDKRAELPDRKFEDVESKLEAGWLKARGKSRLAWEQAKSVVRAGWHAIERILPGDADRDGR